MSMHAGVLSHCSSTLAHHQNSHSALWTTMAQVWGPSVKNLLECFQEEFNKPPSMKQTVLQLVQKFRHTGSVLCQGCPPKNSVMPEERPTSYGEETEREAVTMWGTISSHCVIGSYFVDDEERCVIVNSHTYCQQSVELFMHDLRAYCRAGNFHFMEQWFQQDGATAHTEWVYRDPVPRNIEQLKTNIRCVIYSIYRHKIAGMFVNLQQSYGTYIELADSYVEHIV
ncbi:hypothetical protein PR048_025676 [Dryococelus australis]|uniref:Uncharacterized protein n=1 Tax=Dryococelus australis TaxID=614101 RepID=A0ABQ9GJ78_9NEOP|nr:hypothetical protein PR048_025676 [Dryococelus australis]